MKITDDEQTILGVIHRVDRMYGKGQTPLFLIVDFVQDLPQLSKYKLRKLLTSLTAKGILHEGKWDRSSCWILKKYL
jgi:hypothetical protein